MSLYAYARTLDGHLLERAGLDFEEFQVGQRFAHRPGRTVSQQDNVMESLDTLNAAMLHYDNHYAAQTSWKNPLMVSTITLQALLGMSSRTFARRQRIVRFATIAMTAPVFGGDTLYSESEIAAVTDDGQPDTGRVTVFCQGLNQKAEVVAKLTYDALIWRAGKGPVFAPAHVNPLEPAQEHRFLSHHRDGSSRWVEQTGLFFEDFQTGETFLHWPCRTLGAHEGMVQAWRALETGPQYQDQAWIAHAGGGVQSLTQAWVIGVATALTTRTFGRVVANLGWQDVELHQDMAAGDTIRCESTVLEMRLSGSRPHEGLLTVRTQAFDQTGRKLLSYVRNLLVYKKSAPSPYAAADY
ncbi:MAG: MaoC family dehydratase [Burkholderiaceae bacterium]